MVYFAFSASYFSLLAQRTSNQKKVHPSFRLFLALLGLPGVHRNSPWQATQDVACCGAQTADGRELPPILRCSARQMGTPKTYERHRLVDITKESGFCTVRT